MDAQASFLLSQSIESEGRKKRAGTSELVHLRGDSAMYRAVSSDCGVEVSRSKSAFGTLGTAEVWELRTRSGCFRRAANSAKHKFAIYVSGVLPHSVHAPCLGALRG